MVEHSRHSINTISFTVNNVTQQKEISATDIVCRHIVITGFVQGVGFRPFVFRLANELQIKGYVANNTGQVTIAAESTRETLELFCEQLISQAPVNAKPVIQSMNEIALLNYTDFSIRDSHELNKSDIHILPDLPVCEQCLEELFDKNNRRYLYPFINCTQCGPRYSIISALPYDRKNTSMQSFKLCNDCETEYLAPNNRRFHAEPVVCDACGPVLNYVDDSHSITDNFLALEACIKALKAGKIIAVKGIGGYHLMCDATSSAAITLLRKRKQRADKPFAVLMEQSQIENYVEVTNKEANLLQQSCRPIALLKYNNKDKLASNLAPGINRVGVMLPNSPLQHLLCYYFKKPLVATSANISGEPIITDNKEATKRLANLCDGFLHHNRDIIRPADDAVMLHNTVESQLLRSGRGLAPTELSLPFNLEQPVLAVGGHMKNTIALGWDNRLLISAHNGDLGSLRSYQTFQQAITDLQQLYKVKAEVIVCDAHPGYSSSQWANESGLPVIKTYHHYAHASSLALENPENNQWLIFSWDGIGLGPDGTLWGGETLLGIPGNWQRVASFKTFTLPGGDKTSREPWRIAASLYWQSNIDFDIKNVPANKLNIDELKIIWQKNINCPESSAAGRLFSAAASILGLVSDESFEGHGPMLLEALAEGIQADALSLPLIKDDDGIVRIDWTPLVQMLMDNNLSKVYRARCFHESMAECICQISLPYCEQHNDLTIGLSGGVFQNQLLVGLIRRRLDKYNVSIVMPASIPVNDGGLCVGQIIEHHYQ